MYYYSSDGVESNYASCPWTASEEDGKLKVCYRSGATYSAEGIDKSTYIVGELVDACNLLDGKDGKIWYSFDYNTYNFHIVPDEEWAGNYIVACKNMMDAIAKALNSKYGIVLSGRGGGCKKYTKCHRYKYVSNCEDGYEYVISFNTLTCEPKTDDGNTSEQNDSDRNASNNNYVIKNYLGKIQFYRYKKNINQKAGNRKIEFQMMYPESPNCGCSKYDKETGHFVYNTEWTVQNGDSDVKDKVYAIADQFHEFIEGKLRKE